ncbi:MAG: hypothetical protein J6L77_09995 [Coprococcus sp.]|nr:hypothetical protein [Coprococcus sp.]
MFENEKVNHVKFGEGNVLECDGTHIKIVFYTQNLEKTFSYPGVFEKFLNFHNQDAQARVAEELTSAKAEELRINNMKRLLYMEAEKRRKQERLLKQKKK